MTAVEGQTGCLTPVDNWSKVWQDAANTLIQMNYGMDGQTAHPAEGI